MHEEEAFSIALITFLFKEIRALSTSELKGWTQKDGPLY